MFSSRRLKQPLALRRGVWALPPEVRRQQVSELSMAEMLAVAAHGSWIVCSSINLMEPFPQYPPQYTRVRTGPPFQRGSQALHVIVMGRNRHGAQPIGRVIFSKLENMMAR